MQLDSEKLAQLSAKITDAITFPLLSQIGLVLLKNEPYFRNLKASFIEFAWICAVTTAKLTYENPRCTKVGWFIYAPDDHPELIG